MNNEEKIDKHIKEKCRFCIIKECDGIRITLDGKTRCEQDILYIQRRNDGR